MNLEDLNTDDVYFEDENRQRKGPYKTKFGSSEIIVFDQDLVVTEDFIAINPLPNGREQRFSIVDVQFSSGLGPIKPHFLLQIEKESKRKSQAHALASNTYNINHSNVQVGDGTVQNILNSFEQLITEIEQSDPTPFSSSHS